MPERKRIGLDNTALSGRLRTPRGRAQFSLDGSQQRPSARYFNDVVASPYRQPTKKLSPVVAKPAATSYKAPAMFERPALWDTVRPPTRLVNHKTRRSKGSKSQVVMLTLACIVFVAGLGVSLITLQTNKVTKTQVAALSKQADSNGDDSVPPSETKPTTHSVANYSVAPDLPRLLKIPKLGVNTRVKSLSVTATGDLQAPNNIYDAGWYSSSAHPGDAPANGAVLIDGHVHGPTLPGVFDKLASLVTGDAIQITRGDGKIFNYKVVKTQNYDASTLDMSMALSSIKPGEPGLNLITCGGPYDKQTGHYTQRTVVFAVQI